MPDPPFEHCALQCAEFWFTIDRHLVAGLASSRESERLEALRKAAGYFRVARNLPLAHDVHRGYPRLGPLMAILDRHAPGLANGRDSAEVVYRVRDELSVAYGGKALLSAATKFLWLAHRDQVVIYDTQARLALNTPEGDYDLFLSAWRKSYRSARKAISHACSILSTGVRFLSCGGSLSAQDIDHIAAEEWFRQRVHDIYLWKAGAP